MLVGLAGKIVVWALELKVANRLEAVAEAIEAFQQVAIERAVPPAVIPTVQLVLDDILVNILSYAWPEGGDHQARLRIAIESDVVLIEVSDDGVPFDPVAAPVPDISLDVYQRQTGGLGIHLARSLMDDVTYARRGGRNVLTMKKEV